MHLSTKLWKNIHELEGKYSLVKDFMVSTFRKVNLSTKSGDVECDSVIGDLSTISGEVSVGLVSGSVKTVSGDVRYKK